MKKYKLLAAILVVAIMTLAAVACADVTVDKITVKDGTIATQIEQNQTLDTSDLVVIAKYSDGSEKEINASDLTICEFSTAELGEKELVISFEDVSVTVMITVIKPYDPNSDIVIETVSLPDFVKAYNNNVAEKTNKQEEFSVRDDAYYVGDDNAFAFKPSVVAVDDDGDAVNVPESMLDMSVIVKVSDGQNYVNATASDYVEVLSYGSLQFTQQAIGKQIEITVKPFVKGYPENAAKSVSFKLSVVDGFNAYTATDLAVIEHGRMTVEDSDKDQRCADGWASFKQEHNLPTEKVNAVIMHGNISVTAADVPSAFFYKDGDSDLNSSDADYARAKDSLRDNLEIYYRAVDLDDEFALIGNYFTLDASQLPYVTRESDKVTKVGEVISHASLIRFMGRNDTKTEDSTQANSKATMKNLFIIGNSNRSETPEASGGIICHKAQRIDITIDNTITRKMFIAFFGERKDTSYTLTNSKAYDSFNSFMYFWGCGNVNIDKCELIGAGGPVMIVDHLDPNAADGGEPTNIKVTNSNLVSNVTGEEGWFTLVNAKSLVPTIKALDGLIRAYDKKTFLRSADGNVNYGEGENSYFNFIAIIKSSTATGPSDIPIKGSLAIDSNAPLNFFEDNAIAKAYFNQVQSSGAPLFQSSVGAIGHYDGNQIIDATTGTPATATADSYLFSGDYLSMYYSYMGIMFGYYDLNSAAA